MMDLPVKLEDIVKSLAEKALEQENAAKHRTAHEGGEQDGDEDSDEHEFDDQQLEQMLEEEKSKKRQTRRARASGAPSSAGRAGGANKRKLAGETVSGGNSKRACSSAFDSTAEVSGSKLHADNAQDSTSRRPSRKISKGTEIKDDVGLNSSESELKPVKIEPASENNNDSGQFAADRKLSTLSVGSTTKPNLKEEVNDDGDVEKRTEFLHISKSIVKHKRSRIDKAHQDLVKIGCDCYLSPDDIKAGRVACCDDSCSNRAVCIECPPKCRLGRACCNQRMQRGQYASLEIRYAGKKGYGLYAAQPVEKGDLIIEYVGEIVSSRQFNKRAKQYEKGGIRHHYFMSLNNDEVIDATRKGNDGRFINHCCEPNCETQKWIVGGETRIGFFARRDIAAGEELSIDYQFVRFGSQTATRCLCGAQNCRGFIGAESSSHATSARSGKTQFEIDLQKLIDNGALKTSANALKFAHVFIHATKDDDILTLVRVLQNSEQYSDGLKAFLRLHGLNILHCYMTQLKFSKKPLPLMNELMAVLQALVDSNAITSRNGLEDSGIMRELDEWAGVRPPQMPVTTMPAANPATSTESRASKRAVNAAGSLQKPEISGVVENNSASSNQVNASTLIESTLEQLKRDEAEQERARVDKILSKVSTQLSSLDLVRHMETFETGMIDCCKAPSAEERRQHAQVMVLKSASLSVETAKNDKLLKKPADFTIGTGTRKTSSAEKVRIEEKDADDDFAAASRRSSAAAVPLSTPNPSAEIVMDAMGYSSSSDEDDSDDTDEDDDENDNIDDAGKTGEAADTTTDELLTMLDDENRSATPAPAASSLSSKFSTPSGKFTKHSSNMPATPARVAKQTPYMRFLTFLNHLERQARAAEEQEQHQQRRLARIAAKQQERAENGENLADISFSSSNVDADDAMDIVATDEEDAASRASVIGFRENSLGLPSPHKIVPSQQTSALALLEQADEQFQHDIAETQRLRRYTLEFIDYCKQNLHIVFKIQKRSSTQTTTATQPKLSVSTKNRDTAKFSSKDVKTEAENNQYRTLPSKTSSTNFSLPPPPQSVMPPQQNIPATNYVPPPQPPTPQALYDQHKKLMADFIPVLYADEEKRRIEREKLGESSKGTEGQALTVTERTAQMFEKQVEKQDMFDAWMMAVNTSARNAATSGAATGTTSQQQSKEAHYVTQHRQQVLKTVMHYMNGTRKQPDKWRVKQEVRQQKQRILAQPNYFMHVPAPHHGAAAAAAGPRPNQELKASIYSRIQTDVCACVAEKVSQKFGQLLNDAKGEDLQKRLYVMLPTGERVLLSDNKCTFENQRKLRRLMPLKYGTSDWNFRLLQLKRFRLVREFLNRQSKDNTTVANAKPGADDTSNKLSNIPPLCNPTTAGYTSNFDHVFYSTIEDADFDAENPAAADVTTDVQAENDSAGFRLPLPHGINVAFNQQGPKGLLYCWDEETLQSSWLMPSAHLEETIDDFVRAAVPMSSAPPPTKVADASSRNGIAGGSTIRLPHEATFTRFVWKDGFKTALPQTFENEWLDLLHQDAVSLSDINSSIAAAASATANAAATAGSQPQQLSTTTTPSSGTTIAAAASQSSSLAEWQAAAASTLLRRNRHAAAPTAAAAAANIENVIMSPSTSAALNSNLTANSGENGGSSSGGGIGESRSRHESGATSAGGNSALATSVVETVLLTKAEFRDRVSRHVITALNPYRKSTCQKGRIRNKDDFKTVARELTHKIVDAELKRHSEQQLRSTSAVRCFVYSSKLETKIDTYIAKYMQRFGKNYDPDIPVPSTSILSSLTSRGNRAGKNRVSVSSPQHQLNQSFENDDDDRNEQPPSADNGQTFEDEGTREPDDGQDIQSDFRGEDQQAMADADASVGESQVLESPNESSAQKRIEPNIGGGDVTNLERVTMDEMRPEDAVDDDTGPSS